MFGVQDGGCVLRDRGLGTPSPSMEGRGDVGMAKVDPGRTTSTEFQVLDCFPRSCYPVLHSGVDCLSLICSQLFILFLHIFFLGLQFANSNKVSVPQICFVFFCLYVFFMGLSGRCKVKTTKGYAVCSLSSIEDAFTTSAQEIVADSLGATPALTESGGVTAGEETGVRIATIFLFLWNRCSLQAVLRSEWSAKSCFQKWVFTHRAIFKWLTKVLKDCD